MSELPDGAFRAPTLASVVARQIEDEVVAAGWPVGAVLGSESELLERFGVSRSVLREAVRIVEHTGAATMRRGPNGGLVVMRPSRDAIVTATGIWASYAGVTMSELLEVRAPLLRVVVRLAAERGTPEAAEELVAEAHRLAALPRIRLFELVAFEGQVAAMSGSTALALFIDTLADIGRNRVQSGWAAVRPAFTRADLARHAGQYEELTMAIAAGDADRAGQVNEQLLDDFLPRIFDVRKRTATRRPPDPRAGKLAEQVAMALCDDIELAGWPVGAVVGSETELIERHSVSRAVFREAVRILEYHGAVRTKRGPGGGLLVAAPDLVALRRSLRLYLEQSGITPAVLTEMRSLVEGEMARLAAERITPEGAERLREQLVAEPGRGPAARRWLGLHGALAEVTGNRVLMLFVEVLDDLVPGHVRRQDLQGEARERVATAVRRSHTRIVDAVVAGDGESARRRMCRHVDATQDVLQ